MLVALLVSVPHAYLRRGSNVLLIVTDNLRPSLGAYGEAAVLTPHIDGLAAASGATLFARAYCQEAWCSPSRNSFLSGRRPDTTQAWGFVTSFRDSPNGGENWTTLPGHFKEHGYFTASAGKVFHPNLPINFDYPRSWSVQPTLAEKDPCFDVQRGENVSNSTMSCSFAPGDGHLDADSTCADQVLANLDAWEANFSDGTPFFLAAGFQSPRLPWSYPQSVADRYPAADKIPIVNPALRQSPTDASLALEWFRPTEIDWYTDVKAGHARPMGVAQQHDLYRAYYAAISHVDDQVGRLIAVLKNKGLYDDTVVVFTADHGQNLGELNMWSMMNLLEPSLRVPLIIKPSAAASSSSISNVQIYSHPVELVDLFPTLVALARVAPIAADQHLAGIDLSHVMRSGASKGVPAYSQITRCSNCTMAYAHDETSYQRGCAADREDNADFTVPCALTPAASYDYMGMSVRTDDWRYSIWCKWQGRQGTLAVDWTQCKLPELYNHTADSALFDVQTAAYFHNVAGAPRTASMQSKLHALLRINFAHDDDDAPLIRGTEYDRPSPKKQSHK